MTHNPDFKDMPLYDVECRKTVRDVDIVTMEYYATYRKVSFTMTLVIYNDLE